MDYYYETRDVNGRWKPAVSHDGKPKQAAYESGQRGVIKIDPEFEGNSLDTLQKIYGLKP